MDRYMIGLEWNWVWFVRRDKDAFMNLDFFSRLLGKFKVFETMRLPSGEEYH